MKKLILSLIACILLGALVIVFIPFAPSETAQPVVGADRDAHGCIASAGYTYSVVRAGCIRVWEAGTELLPTLPADGPVLAAYVVQSENGQEAEVFMPGTKQGLLMSRDANTDAVAWAAPGGWLLTYDPDRGWKLLQGGTLLFASKAQ